MLSDKFVTVGVTGQIGAGKSEATRILAEIGDGTVIDADSIGRQVVDQSEPLRRRLAARFGADILTRTGRLRRKTLAALAFRTPDNHVDLNRLVHPFLLKELRRQVREACRSGGLVLVDAALLLDWNLDQELDLTLVIHASREVRFERLANRGIDLDDARARQKSQLPYTVYRSRADRLILNNGDLDDLRQKLLSFHKKFIRNRLTNG